MQKDCHDDPGFPAGLPAAEVGIAGRKVPTSLQVTGLVRGKGDNRKLIYRRADSDRRR